MNADFFQANRRALLEKMSGGSLIVLTGYEEMQLMNDAAAPFEQEANFWYLSGVEAPGWWLVIDGMSGSEWLVAPELSETQKIFDGGADIEDAKRISGIKTVIDRDEALRRLRTAATHHSVVYTAEQPQWLREHAHFQLNNAQHELKKMLERTFRDVRSCGRELAVLRTIKHPEEIEAIKRAIGLTGKALESMKSMIHGARYEYELEAIVGYEFRKAGARHAYAPIVASGLNACTLHYGANADRLDKRTTVLLDVGARVDGYAADISRTYSLSKPTKRQAALYAAVLGAQQDIIGLLKPGLLFREYEERVEEIMKRALAELGLSEDRYREYFPHAVSHGLGIDVHDALAGYETMQPGMVLTVEPGLYIIEESLGVRIEDDILITDSGYKNLSHHISTSLV